MSISKSLPAFLHRAPALVALTSIALGTAPLASAEARAPRRAASVQIAVADEARPVNVVVNGSFELPALDDGTWNVFEEIRGWRTAAGPGIEIQRGVAGSPLDGAQHVELDSHASSAMYQILDTQPDHRYLITYWVSPRPGTAASDNRLALSWDGAVIDRYAATDVGDDTAWVRREVIVTAHHRESRIQFADVSESNSVGAYLDEVSVVDVSTP
ncbi:MAG: hypothetical protein K8W52_35620 [Deltaproteobacteria bacterium]|nr:hypothetical protein [Deltaproteobacteria bacterium]